MPRPRSLTGRLACLVVLGVCREIDEKAELLFKDELQNLVAAVWRNRPPFAVRRLAGANAFLSRIPAGQNQDARAREVTLLV